MSCGSREGGGRSVRSIASAGSQEKKWGFLDEAGFYQIWQSEQTKIWAGPAVG